METLKKLLSTRIKANNFLGCSNNLIAVLAPAPLSFSISVNQFGLREKKETSEADAKAEPTSNNKIIAPTTRMVNVEVSVLTDNRLMEEEILSKI